MAFTEHQPKRSKWAIDYRVEARKGIVLLQREKYLRDQRMEIMAAIEQEQDLKSQDTSVIDELEKINAEILQVKHMFRDHEERMRVLWSTFKDNSFSREVLVAQKAQYSLITGRQPYAWVQKRNHCSDSGGCCGRECGCCERPLKVVIKHGMSVFGPRQKKSGVYGHCSAECGCCIRYKGFYKPDARLEKESN